VHGPAAALGVDGEPRLVARDLGVDLVARSDVGRVRGDEVERAAGDRSEQVAREQLDALAEAVGGGILGCQRERVG
jgi:hypothetical protein